MPLHYLLPTVQYTYLQWKVGFYLGALGTLVDSVGECGIPTTAEAADSLLRYRTGAVECLN